MFKKLNKNIKGFTLMELIIVMAVIGILVMLAVPKFQEFRDRAYQTQIKNDSKVVKDLSAAELGLNEKLPKNNKLTKEKINGLIKDGNSLYFNGDSVDSFNLSEGGEYYQLDAEFLKNKVNTNLTGCFIIDDELNVYYIDNRVINLKPNKNEEVVFDFVTLGTFHSAAITEDGDLYTWGNGKNGKLGHEDTENKTIPTKVEGISKVKEVSLGDSHSVALTEDGDLYTWGSGTNGKLGHGDTQSKAIPTKVEGISNVKQVALGNYHSAAITQSGELYTWGSGTSGTLGHGGTESKDIPTKVEGISNVKQVSLGGFHSAAITEDGSLYTWGDGGNGRLGHGDNDTEDKKKPTKVEGISKVKQVSLGAFHSVAITENGDIYTWGVGDSGRLGLGDNDTEDINKPTKVEGISNVKEVALGDSHSAAITEDGSLYTWGKGEDGKLGHEDTENKTIPTKVKGISNVKQVVLGEKHSAAITEDGELYTWGVGSNGQLGLGSTEDKNIPIKVNISLNNK